MKYLIKESGNIYIYQGTPTEIYELLNLIAEGQLEEPAEEGEG